MADLATPDVTADSSPVVAPQTAPLAGGASILERLTPEQRQNWKLTGTVPDSPQTPDAESSPATPVEQAASTDATDIAPASEPGNPPKKNADTRKAQLKAEIETEARRLRELREARIREEGRLEALKPAKPNDENGAKSSPAQADAGFRFHTFDEFLSTAPDASYEDYTDARTDARFAFREQQQREVSEREGRSKAFTDQVKTFQERMTEATKADPAFQEALSPEILSLRPSSYLSQHGEPITPHSELAERILKSPVGPQLARHFSTNPQDFARFTSQLPPDEFYVELGKLEGRLEGGTAPTPEKPAKYISTAPTPGTSLGTRPAAAGDPIVNALARKDFAAFKRAQDARDLAARR